MPSGTRLDTWTFNIENGSLCAQSNMQDTNQARKFHTESVMNWPLALTNIREALNNSIPELSEHEK
jgi:hypothetical protein